MVCGIGCEIRLGTGEVVILRDCIEGKAFVEYPNPVPWQINGEIQPGTRKTVWIDAPGWIPWYDPEGAKIGMKSAHHGHRNIFPNRTFS
jgi:hypothetical protein